MVVRSYRNDGFKPLCSKLDPMTALVVTIASLLLLIALSSSSTCSAFAPPPPPPRGNNIHHGSFDNDDDEGHNGRGLGARHALLGVLISSPSLAEEERTNSDKRLHELSASTYMYSSTDQTRLLQIRGGGGIVQKISQKRNDMIEGVQNAIDDTLSYWGGALEFIDTRFLPGGRARQGRKKRSDAVLDRAAKSSRSSERRGGGGGGRKGKMTKEEKKAMKQLDTVSVRAVTAPNSTLLPSSVVADAGRQSGLVGNKFLPEAASNCAARLGKWYSDAGYILNSVTGATLDADTGTAKLEVQEATVSTNPVDVVCVKEVVVDNRTGETMSIGAYRRKLAAEGDGTVPQSFNTTLIETKAKTRPSALAGALNLHPGEPFKWDETRWEQIQSSGSGLFSRVWSVSTTRTPDGTVQLRVVASEAPSRSLEYGVTKSLYNDLWEGELDFSNANMFGGGERLGLMVRRGRREPQPSFNVKFTGNALSEKGPYDIEAFNEYIGVTGHEGGASSRRGLTVRFPNIFSRTSASASIEKTSARTKTGEHDRLAHANFDIGPFIQNLPASGRASVQGTANIGAKLDIDKIKKGGKSIMGGMTPYSSYTATTRQIVSLNFPSKASGRPITLALQHRGTVSTSELPEHEALAVGFATRVRGYSPRKNGPLSSSLVGTAEIRVPVPLPTNNLVEDGSVVFFGDWMLASRWTIRDIKNKVKNKALGSASASLLTRPSRKSSVGIGVRSVLQGIPVKVDFYLTDDGLVGTHFGLGRDFSL